MELFQAEGQCLVIALKIAAILLLLAQTGTVSTDFFDFNTGQGAGVVVVRFYSKARYPLVFR